MYMLHQKTPHGTSNKTSSKSTSNKSSDKGTSNEDKNASASADKKEEDSSSIKDENPSGNDDLELLARLINRRIKRRTIFWTGCCWSCNIK